MKPVVMPSEAAGDIGGFDRFAGWAADVASRASFFTVCVLLVVVWAPSYYVFRNGDMWQLVINTTTTIITFLMVALLQNTQMRNDQALHHKLNALAEGLADMMTHQSDPENGSDLHRDIAELRLAVGLEARETTSRRGRRSSAVMVSSPTAKPG